MVRSPDEAKRNPGKLAIMLPGFRFASSGLQGDAILLVTCPR